MAVPAVRIRAVPPAVLGGVLVQPTLHEAELALVEERLVDVQVSRGEDRQVLVVPFVQVDPDLGCVVPQHGRERLRLGLEELSVIAVQVRAGLVAARVGCAAVAVDRRDDQDGRLPEDVQDVRVLAEREHAREDEARLASLWLVPVDVAVVRDRR